MTGKVSDEKMISTRELYNIITGRSCLTDPKCVEKELRDCKALFDEGINYYKKPNSSSEDKVKKSASVKRKEFILQLSKILELDEWQTHELFINFLRLEFKGSAQQFQSILKHAAQVQGFQLKVLEFYLKERSFLLKCISHLVAYWQAETCLLKDAFTKFVEEILSNRFIEKTTKQLKHACKRLTSHNGITGNHSAQEITCQQNLKEQCALLEICILYYKDFEMSAQVFMDFAKFLRRQYFGMSQVERKLITAEGQIYVQQFGYLASFLLLQGIDLEGVYHQLTNKSSEIEHHLLSSNIWQKIDELLYSWDDVDQQAPVLLAWTLFHQVCLPDHQQKLTRYFGESAFRCNILRYLNDVACNTCFHGNQLLGGYMKALIYMLMNITLKLYHAQSVPDAQVILPLMCEVFKESSLVSLYFLEEQKGGIHVLTETYKLQFPFAVGPLTSLLTSLCVDAHTAELVFNIFEQLNVYTELFSNNDVSEVTCTGEKTWRRVTGKTLLSFADESLDLPHGSYGKISNYKQDCRLIRWTYQYSGWTYLYFLLNTVADNLLTYTSGAEEDGLDVCHHLVCLVNAVIEHDATKVEQFEPVVTVVFKLIRRLCNLKKIPADKVAAYLACVTYLTPHYPQEMWMEVGKTGLLPSPSKSGGILEHVLNDIEQTSGVFPLTLQYLTFILTYLQNRTTLTDGNADRDELLANLAYVLRCVFSVYTQWWFGESKTKHNIGMKCLEIFHHVLQDRNSVLYSSLMGELHNSGDGLLNVVCIGVNELENHTIQQNTRSSLIQLVKIALSVLNKLLCRKKKEVDGMSRLEQLVSTQFMQKTSDTDYVQTQAKVSVSTVIGKYIHHMQDAKLPILAVITLTTIADLFPMVLTANLGECLEGLRNAFVNRLSGHVEPIRLKVAVIELLTSCVSKQPGMVEALMHFQTGKEHKFGRFSCVIPVLSILSDKNAVDVLTTACTQFLAALWFNRYTNALTLIKKSENVWKNITFPLKVTQTEEDLELMEATINVLNIISLESYYVKSELYDEDLKTHLKEISNQDFYAKINKMIVPSSQEHSAVKLSLVQAWRMYLSVMTQNQCETTSLDQSKVIDDIFCSVMLSLDAWTSCDGGLAVVEELSTLLLVLFNKWKRSLTCMEKWLVDFLDTAERITNNRTADEKYINILVNVYTLANAVIQHLGEHPSGSLKHLLTITCQHLEQTETYTTQTDTLTTCMIHLLSEIMLNSQDECFVHILHEHTTVYVLLQLIKSSLQKGNMRLVESTLTLLVSISQTEKGGDLLRANNIGNFFCLDIKPLLNDDSPEQSSFNNSWANCIKIMTRMLRMLKFAFLQPCIDFLGAYKEFLFKSLELVDQIKHGGNLQLAEETTAFLFEVSHYQSQFSFALSHIFDVFKKGIAYACKLAISLLSRPNYLNMLREGTASTSNQEYRTPSPISSRSDSLRSDPFDGFSLIANTVHMRLVNIISNCTSALRCLTPHVTEAILDEGMDIDCFVPLLDLNMCSPSLDGAAPSFGTLVACANTSVKIIHKLSLGDRNTPDRDSSFSINFDDDKAKSTLWLIVDNSVVVLLSQASCYLRHTNVSDRSKQFLKRELGTELSNFLYAVHRLKSRRGVPPSPLSSGGDKTPVLRRSPSKMATFIEENENSLFKLVDLFIKQLLR